MKLIFLKTRRFVIGCFVELQKNSDGTYRGWWLALSNDGYMKDYIVSVDLLNTSILKKEVKIAKRQFIKWVIFEQDTEYNRDKILKAISEIDQVEAL